MSENTPLLSTPQAKQAQHGFFSPYRRMLALAFALSVSFAFTATPILYLMSRMTCEEYYKTHPEPSGPGDRCAIHEIEASTASSLSLMVTGTTVSGVLNLLTTGYIMRRWGIRAALITQTAWPCLRNMCQITAVLVGGNVGIRLFQTTQLITILGGGAGYILCANSFVAAVVPAEERTGAFGQLSGVCMLGTAVAFTLGGLAGEYISPAAPFEITLCLLVISTFLSYFTLPYIPPAGDEKKTDGTASEKKKPGAIMSFFEPLKVFGARKLEDGKGRRYWGVTILGIGAFTSVLATAYVPFMLQLVATNLYGFKTAQNGYLMSCFAIVRAGFLTLAFPKIIKYGRIWYSSSPQAATSSAPTDAAKPKDDAVVTVASRASRSPSLDGESTDTAIERDDTPVVKQPAPKQDTAFDLLFLRLSILVDAAMTCLVTFSSKGWHMYAAALVIPLASGTAPACKGVMMEMVTAAQRPDALSAISLVEVLATVSTVSLFGAIFAYLSEIGQPNLVFVLNAATAVIATFILCFAYLPPQPAATENASEAADA